MSQDKQTTKDESKGARYPVELWATIQELWEGVPYMSYGQAAKAAGARHGIAPPSKGACAAYATRNSWVKGGNNSSAETSSIATKPVPDKAERLNSTAQTYNSPPTQPDAGKHTHKPARTSMSETEAGIAPQQIEAEMSVDLLLAALTDKQRLFALEYLIDLNATAAYMRAFKISHKTTAASNGHRMLRNAEVEAYIRAKIDDRSARTETDADRVVLEWRAIAIADPNEICEYRRVCCRHCYGIDHRYQFTPAEMEKVRKDHEKERGKTLADTNGKYDIGEFDELGGLGFNGTFDPNPDCPECFGEGVGRAFFKDTRKLSPAASALYGGIKIGRDGVEVKIHSKDNALDSLARHNQMFVEKHEVNVTSFDPQELEARFGTTMASARKRMQAIKQERGLDDEP